MFYDLWRSSSAKENSPNYHLFSDYKLNVNNLIFCVIRHFVVVKVNLRKCVNNLNDILKMLNTSIQKQKPNKQRKTHLF